MGEQTEESYWNRSIRQWYPELHSRTYFLPPLHFNRLPYSVDSFAGEQVLVPGIPLGGPGQVASPSTPVQKRHGRQPNHKSASQRIPQEPPTNLLRQSRQDYLRPLPVQSSEVRDDSAQQRVIHSLRVLAENSRPQEVMMVISQLQFGKYLHKPSYASTTASLPRPVTLPQKEYQDGDFDVLIIHRRHGLITLEIKSVGANFNQLNMTQEQKEVTLRKKVKEAIKQLNKAEIVLKHLVSELPGVKIMKSLALPNVGRHLLSRAIDGCPAVEKDLCTCLGSETLEDALKLCLLSDQLCDTPWDTTKPHVMGELHKWLERLTTLSGRQATMTPNVYEILVSRFCGPATTVEIHGCVTAARLEQRTEGEGVHETGERVARLVLYPQQVELLHAPPPRVFLNGPPGTGKTVILVLHGLSWLQRGRDVHVVSLWLASLAAAFLIEHQLQRTIRAWSDYPSGCVYRHKFDFEIDSELENAVTKLGSITGENLLFIMDEAAPSIGRPNRDSFIKVCDRLSEHKPDCSLWVATVHNDLVPLILTQVTLTVPLRSPPVVVREVTEAGEVQTGDVYEYSVNNALFPTDGPATRRISHREGQSGHTGSETNNCVECGRQVARVLRELNVGQIDADNRPSYLEYRDVLVLCYDYPPGGQVDNSGHVNSMGLVQGLRECHIPVRVVEREDEAAIRDTALGVSDQVTVTSWHAVHGLERKVVFAQRSDSPHASSLYNRICGASRCTSQLVWIDVNPWRDEM